VIRVLVVDDHSVVRGGLEQLLATADDIALVGSATNGAEAVVAHARLAPDITLMDLSMPVADGIEATRRILEHDPEARVVVLTSFSGERKIADALDAGAVGYVLKHAGPEDLIGAIRAAAEGGAPLDPKAARVLLDRQRVTRPGTALSPREQEVLDAVAEGLANKQIARRLGIAERTVKAHLTNIFQRIGVSDRTQAALWAREHTPGQGRSDTL
jgi:DNA-binding NarL/FixJ family response regulator